MQAQRYSSAIYDACRGVIPKSCAVASSHPFSRPSVRDEARKSARAVSQVPLQHDRARTHGSSVGLRARPPRHRAATPPTLRASGRAGRNRTLAPRTPITCARTRSKKHVVRNEPCKGGSGLQTESWSQSAHLADFRVAELQPFGHRHLTHC